MEMRALSEDGREALVRVLHAIDAEASEATGFVAGYLASLAEDLTLLTCRPLLALAE